MAQQNNKESGFTIIELLIVLGIAGLIFSLIFLAIPALQRSGRNNQRKQDVATVLQGISRYMLNHVADLPTVNPPGPNNGLDQFSPNTYFLSGQTLSYYTYSAAGIVKGQLTSTAAPETNVDVLSVYNYAKCTANGGADSSAADYRDVAALYSIETSTGSIWKCQQL